MAAATSYVLGYWKIRGLGAVARMQLSMAGASWANEYQLITYDDAGAPLASTWDTREGELMKEHPYVNLPFLKVTQGATTFTIVQSNAINRFLAATFGFVPKTPLDAALADEVLEHLLEMKAELSYLAYRPADFAKDKADFCEKSVPYYLGKLETRLKHRSDGTNAAGAAADPSAFLSGGEAPCWQDLYVFEVCDVANVCTEGAALKAAPTVAALCARVRAYPGLTAYFASEDATLPMNTPGYASFATGPSTA